MKDFMKNLMKDLLVITFLIAFIVGLPLVMIWWGSMIYNVFIN